MNVRRGEIWLADLNPIQGSEQAGTRPILVFQNNVINRFTTTILAIPSRPISVVPPYPLVSKSIKEKVA